jgi:hypothetical protein
MRNILALVALTVCGLLGANPASGQRLSIPRGNTETELKAEAEKEGAVYSRTPTRVTEAEPRVCAIGLGLGPARSGEFTIGGNLGGGAAMRAGRPGKVWWSPLYATRDMPPLLVRGRSLTNPQDTVRFTSANVAWPVTPGAPPIPEAERKYFFPSGITIPTPGRWLVIATSGPNWGCFILSVVS